MTEGEYFYRTRGGVTVTRSAEAASFEDASDRLMRALDEQRGGLLASSYEYPGRYKRWSIGFVNPPLELSSRGRRFTITAHNERGAVLLPFIEERLRASVDLEAVTAESASLTGSIKEATGFFTEEERSKRPSIFSVIRILLDAFYSEADEHLGLYGAFGYDLVFQFESIRQERAREADQRDLVLYLPDDILVIDYHRQTAARLLYDFETAYGSTSGFARTGERIDYRGERLKAPILSDHRPGEYADQVAGAMDYFRRGELFEVVLSQSFYQPSETRPSALFDTLRRINPSPYGFILNLGGEYLIGASPEMFVRVEGRRIETCPISGTIRRGGDVLEDAERIRQLLNSGKDETELTMCTDVDRNDKSRICEPGSVQVIGRRQIEMYSHLIHTVDHVEGILRPEFDALDAFLTHMWAVTVTGAPKPRAIQTIEQRERTCRRWYGGAVGYLGFDGRLNTGLTLRTIRLNDSIAEVRAGATLLYDSIPEEEERETLTKAAALFETLGQAEDGGRASAARRRSTGETRSGLGRNVLLIDCEDSFIHTLANYIRQTGAEVTTLRHDLADAELARGRPDLVVLSPGPGRPDEFRLGEKIEACIARGLPIFGVCLGFQAIVEYFGGRLGVLAYPWHGKPAQIQVTTDSWLFGDLPSSFRAGRYHSLYAVPEVLPDELIVTALAEDGVIMAVEHRELKIAGVQFHPESIMTSAGGVGMRIIENLMREITSQPVASPAPFDEAPAAR